MPITDFIVPLPKRFEILEKEPVILGTPGRSDYFINIQVDESDPLIAHAIARLKNRLERLLNSSTSEETAHTIIILSMGDAPEGTANADQGYSIAAAGQEISVTGFGTAGFSYAITTLIQCLKMDRNRLAVPSMKILDWPDMGVRGHTMESRYGTNLMTLQDWMDLIDYLANQKMNRLAVSLYGCWCVQYDNRVSEYFYFPAKKYQKLRTPVVIRYYSPEKGLWVDCEKLPPIFEEDFFGDIIRYGKLNGITVFPLVNSFGHNTLIPAAYPQVSAIDDNGEPTLTGFCTSKQETYDFVYTLYDEIIDRYLQPNGIDSFVIGLDEVDDGIGYHAADPKRIRSPWCKCNQCRDKSRKDLFISHTIRLISHLKSRGMKNIYMCQDMVIRPGRSVDMYHDLIKALRENDLLDVTVMDWWAYASFQERLMFQTIMPGHGLRNTVKPMTGYYHWTVLTHSMRNIALLAQIGMREKAEGMLSYSSWDESYDLNYLCLADFSWNYDGSKNIDQVTDHYIRIHFPTQEDLARKAFQLLYLISEERMSNNTDRVGIYSNFILLVEYLSYYYYTYPKSDRPYPRLFPGEALKNLTNNRIDAERAIINIRSMAKEAQGIFNELAQNMQCDVRIARRFAYDANNYLCLTEDYLAMLRMIDLTESTNGDRFDLIRNLSEQRRLARLSLMAQLERTKEHYLLASQMRNHSIFMQYFADLSGYLTNSRPADIKLDFFDNTHFASHAFWKLR